MVFQKVVKKLVGELLIDFGIITKGQLLQALQMQKEGGKLLGETLVDMGFAREEDIASVVAVQYGIPYLPLSQHEFDKELIKLVPRELALKHRCVPVDRMGTLLTVAMENPLDERAIEDLERVSKHKVLCCVSTPSEILSAIEQHYSGAKREASVPKPVRAEGVSGVRVFQLEGNGSSKE